MSNFQEKLNDLLVQRGFDFASPSPELAWRVFKEWTRERLHWWSNEFIGIRLWDKDEVLWLQLTNTLSAGGDEKYGQDIEFAEVKCLLSRQLPAESTGVYREIQWSPSFGIDLETYYAQVESSKRLKMHMALEGWRWVR